MTNWSRELHIASHYVKTLWTGNWSTFWAHTTGVGNNFFPCEKAIRSLMRMLPNAVMSWIQSRTLDYNYIIGNVTFLHYLIRITANCILFNHGTEQHTVPSGSPTFIHYINLKLYFIEITSITGNIFCILKIIFNHFKNAKEQVQIFDKENE